MIREWHDADAPELAVQANDRRVWLGLRDAFPHPYSLDDAHAFIRLAQGMSPQSFLAIVVDGRIAGGIGYVLKHDVERIGAEVGYWLGHAYWGRGLATASLRELTRLAFSRHPELRRLWAVPFAGNPASSRVLEKAGFVCEGRLRQSAIKDGHVHDQFMYALLRGDLA